jgi:hypothetical protein
MNDGGFRAGAGRAVTLGETQAPSSGATPVDPARLRKRVLGVTMKKLFAIAALVVCVFGSVQAGVKVVTGETYDISQQWWPGVTIVADTGTTTSINEADLTQVQGYWTDMLLTFNDLSSVHKDTSRIITGFNAAKDSLSFAAFAAAVVKGDSFFLSLPDGHPDARRPPAWVIRDSAIIDTSMIYLMNSGAQITSEHLIEYDQNTDSVDTKIVLQIGLSPTMSNNQTSWIRIDSITYSSQDTVVYKAWGAKQCTMFRFILDPVDAPFNVGRNKTRHYGKVIVDK